MTISIKCKKLLDSASVPTRAHEHDAGWDLYSSERSFVISSKRKVVSTSISLAIPDGYVG